MKKDQLAGTGVVFEQKADDLAGNTVEGTDQCASCQRFMSLGRTAFCFIHPGDFLAAAEIVGQIPGKCDHYLKT